MNASLVVALEYKTLDESFLQLVETSDIENQLGNRTVVLGQKCFGERWRLGFFRVGVIQTELIKKLGDAAGVPRVDAEPALLFDLRHQHVLLSRHVAIKL